MLIGDPVLITTTEFGFASTTLLIKISWSPGRPSEDLSFPSVSQSEFVPTTITTASHSLAKETALSIKSSSSGGSIPIWTAGNRPCHLYSISRMYSLPSSKLIEDLRGALPYEKKASPGS